MQALQSVVKSSALRQVAELTGCWWSGTSTLAAARCTDLIAPISSIPHVCWVMWISLLTQGEPPKIRCKLETTFIEWKMLLFKDIFFFHLFGHTGAKLWHMGGLVADVSS